MALTLLGSVPESGQDDFDWLGSANNWGDGSTFSSGSTIALYSSKFYLLKDGSPTGNIVSKIYNYTGTPGTNAKPTGSALATSATYNIASLTGSYQLIEFLFTGVNAISLTGGTKYFVTVEYQGGDASNKLRVGWDSSSPPSGAGNNVALQLSGGTWLGGNNTQSDIFYVYGGVPLTTKTHTTNTLVRQQTTKSHTADASIRVQGTLIDSYSETNTSSNIAIDSSYTDGPRAGQSFAVGASSMKLTSAKFYFRYGAGSPTGNIVATLYAHTGTYGVNGVPTGSILATSDPIPANTIPAGNALYEFAFSGANQYTLAANTKYCIVLDGIAVGNTSNYLSYGVDTTSPTHGGNFLGEGSPGSWGAFASIDMPFYVYGQPTLATITKTHTTDTLSHITPTKTHSTDSLLKTRVTRSHTTDSLVTLSGTRTHTTNALVRLIASLSHTTNALVKRVLTKTHTTNSLVKARPTRTHTANANIRGVYTRSHTTDYKIRGTFTRSHSTDALVEFAHIADGVVNSGDIERRDLSDSGNLDSASVNTGGFDRTDLHNSGELSPETIDDTGTWVKP